MSHSETVKIEVERLCSHFLPKLGEVQPCGRFGCTFGKLFDDDEGQQYFEAILGEKKRVLVVCLFVCVCVYERRCISLLCRSGTLKAAKKQNLVDFKGQMLLKGAHDNVIIYLTKENGESLDKDPSVSASNGVSDLESITQQVTLEEKVKSNLPNLTPKASDSLNGDLSVSTSTTCSDTPIERSDPCKGNLHVFESLMKADELAQESQSADPIDEIDDDNNSSTEVAYPLEKLLAPGPYPNGVDINSREKYLSPSVFSDVFAMERSEFDKLPRWKRDGMKKTHKLF